MIEQLASGSSSASETPRGFFRQHHVNTKASVDDVTLKNFTNLEEEHKRVHFVAHIPLIKEFNDTLKVLKDDDRPSTSTGKKDARRARSLKEDATQAVQKGYWDKALALYTKSYLNMPSENKDEIAIIVANRSAALYHLKFYELALNDISLCLALGYPRDLAFKVLDRRARCYLALKWNNDAIMAFKETISSLDAAKLPNERRQKMQTDAQLMIEILGKSEQMLNPKNKALNAATQMKNQLKTKKMPLPQVSGNNNKVYTSASEAVDIESNEAEGRFAKATRNITVGEIMVVEKAHCSVLLAEHSQTHCQHCFQRCVAPLGCPNCTNVVFCSDKCRKKSLDTYHKYECPVLRILWDSGCSVTCHMALRIISQKRLQYFTEMKQNLKKEFTSTDKYLSDDYRRIYNLVRHENLRTKSDFFERTHMAVFLMNLLKKTDYFKNPNEEIQESMDSLTITEKTEEVTEVESYIGGLLLRNLQIMQFNAHEIFELECEATKPKEGDEKPIVKKEGKPIFIGGGVYATLALFNHSCDPGIVRYYQGTSVIAQAIKNIKNGEQISENYGPLFMRKDKKQRQDEMKDQYWFDCKCTACIQNWPIFEDMTESYMRFKCDSSSNSTCRNVIPVPIDCKEIMVKCGLCQEYTNIMKGLKALQDTVAAHKLGEHFMEKGEYGKALVKFIEELKLYDETLAPPFRDYHLCQQNIRRCLLTFGNVTFV